jgi:peptidoglycan LD-endopeptidase LytH
MKMKRGRSRRRPLIPALAVVFCLGIITGWWLRSGAPLPVVAKESPRSELWRPTVAKAPSDHVVDTLRRRDLRLPIDGADVGAMRGGFVELRDRGSRPHEAVDILGPRNTPVHAVEDGTIARLFTSRAGGITVYQYDPGQQFCYYYAHLERYAGGLRQGQRVARGDVIGYVGTSGNAPPNTPHLHFAVFELEQDGQWWKGRAVDPHLLFED